MSALGSLLPVVIVSAAVVYECVLRPWHLRWGATKAEAEEYLPGDTRVQNPKSQATHAVTIQASPEQVWPWLAQIGQERGGFYSYAWLENLMGCHIRNAEGILPEHQHIQVGDGIWLHPKAPPMPVVRVETGQALVLGSNNGEPGTWGLYLKQVDAHTTRLIARSRWSWKPGALSWLGIHLFLEPAHFIMERKMLLTIKHLAETAPAQNVASPNGVMP